MVVAVAGEADSPTAVPMKICQLTVKDLPLSRAEFLTFWNARGIPDFIELWNS